MTDQWFSIDPGSGAHASSCQPIPEAEVLTSKQTVVAIYVQTKKPMEAAFKKAEHTTISDDLTDDTPLGDLLREEDMRSATPTVIGVDSGKGRLTSSTSGPTNFSVVQEDELPEEIVRSLEESQNKYLRANRDCSQLKGSGDKQNPSKFFSAQ